VNQGHATPGAGSVEQLTGVTQVGQVVALGEHFDRGPEVTYRVDRSPAG
jgi:hypothetical protein